MLTFEELSQMDTGHKRLPGDISTAFWENLYQLFKKRMEEENASKDSDMDDMLKAFEESPCGNMAGVQRDAAWQGFRAAWNYPNKHSDADHVTADVRKYGREVPLMMDMPEVYSTQNLVNDVKRDLEKITDIKEVELFSSKT